MQKPEVDPYDKGREAMDALFEILEGEIIQTLTVECRGLDYHRVHLLLSEYPIQEMEVFPRTVDIDGELVGTGDMEKGEEVTHECVRLL